MIITFFNQKHKKKHFWNSFEFYYNKSHQWLLEAVAESDEGWKIW